VTALSASTTHGFASANPRESSEMLYAKRWRLQSIAGRAAKAALSPTISRVWVGEHAPHSVGEDGGGQCNDKQYIITRIGVCAPLARGTGADDPDLSLE
jgi:hypothetical protein